MLTIIFLVIAIGLALLASIKEYSGLSILLSTILLIWFVSYSIYSGEFHPLNNLTTEKILKDYPKYTNHEQRIEFANILKTELIKRDKDGNILAKFIIYNGSTIFNMPKNGVKYLNKAITAYAWIPKNSEIWKTFLQKDPDGLKEAIAQELSDMPKLSSATYCKLQITKNYILLTNIKGDYSSSNLIQPYFITYRLLNYFLPQTVSGIISIIIEIIALIIIIALISIGAQYIGFE